MYIVNVPCYHHENHSFLCESQPFFLFVFAYCIGNGNYGVVFKKKRKKKEMENMEVLEMLVHGSRKHTVNCSRIKETIKKQANTRKH